MERADSLEMVVKTKPPRKTKKLNVVFMGQKEKIKKNK